MVPTEPRRVITALPRSQPLLCFPPRQDPGGGKDPQTGGAGTGSLCQRHRPGADRGQALQPRGEHTEGVQLRVNSHSPVYVGMCVLECVGATYAVCYTLKKTFTLLMLS